MSRESIQKIREAEKEADRIVNEARERAQQMLADADRDGRALCERTEQETAAQLAAAMQQLKERAAAMTERMDAEGREAAEAMRKEAALRKTGAEKIVIRGLDSKCR